MNFKTFTLFAATAIVFASCKKESHQPDKVIDNIKPLQDSVSLTVNDKLYVFDDKTSSGVSNRATNLKPSEVEIVGGKLGTQTGKYYWYGDKDSTLYSLAYRLQSSKTEGSFNISFSKKFKDTELEKGISLLHLKNDLSMFKPGSFPFAVDLDMENVFSGVAIGLHNRDVDGSTRMPGFSIIMRPSDDTHIQDDSYFEITKVRKLTEAEMGKDIYFSKETYVIEARFEVNLYNAENKKFRAKNGFLRMLVNMDYSSIWGVD